MNFLLIFLIVNLLLINKSLQIGFKRFKPNSKKKLTFDDSAKYCKLHTNNSLNKNIINSALTNENYYPIHLSLEAHILAFALKENRLFWIFYVLSSKSSRKRLELINEFDNQAKQNLEPNFGSKIEKYLNKNPLTFMILFALSQPLYKLDILLFNDYLESSKNINSIIEILIESDYDHLLKITDFFHNHREEFLSSRQNYKKEVLKQILLDKIDNDETGDLISKFFDKKTNQQDLKEIDCIARKIFVLLDKNCQTAIFNCSSSIKINSYKDLNLFLSNLKTNLFDSLAKSFKKITHESKCDPFLKCSNTFNTKYCQSLNIIMSIGENKAEYYAKRINSHLNKNNFDFDLTRLITSINENKIAKDLAHTYNLLFKNDLINHMQGLFTKKSSISEKAWWKFWDKKDGSNDLEIYGRGLMSLIDSNKWCTFQCDVTLNQLMNSRGKKNPEISQKFHQLTKETLNWLLRKP